MSIGSSSRQSDQPDPMFAEHVRDELTAEDLSVLAAGLAGAIRVRNFLPADLCASFVARFREEELSRYDSEYYDLPSYRLGPVINEFQRDGLTDEYWRQVDEAESYWRRIPVEADIRSVCLRKLTELWPRRVWPATTVGRSLFWGIVRDAGNGTRVHWDEVVREPPGRFFDTKPVVQLAFNLFASVPDEGGQAMVWRRRWRPDDEQHRIGYGYLPEVTAGEQLLAVRPQPADAVLFDCRNYHAVEPGKGTRRITMAFFIGLSAAGELLVWS